MENTDVVILLGVNQIFSGDKSSKKCLYIQIGTDIKSVGQHIAASFRKNMTFADMLNILDTYNIAYKLYQ